MMNNIKNNFIAYSVSGQGALALIAIIVSLAVALSPISVLAYVDGDNVYFDNSGKSFNHTNNSSGNNTTYNNNYQNTQPPYINSINPSFIYTGASTTMHIFGGNFGYSSLVRIDGVTYPTSYVDSGHLYTQISSNNVPNVGTHAVTVVNSNGSMSNASYFSVNTGSVKGASVSKAKTTKTVAKNTSGAVAGASDTNYDYEALTSNAVFGGNSFLPSGIMQWLLFAILILLIVIILRKIFVGDDERNKPLKHA